MTVAYITSNFCTLSHTFLRGEITELRSLGLNIALYGMRSEVVPELSGEEASFAKETLFIYPLKILNIFYANLRFMFFRPLNYFRALLQALFNEEVSVYKHLKMIYHFFLSSPMALDMQKREVRHIHAHFMHAPATFALYCSKLLDIPFSVTNHSAGIKTLREMVGLKSKLKSAMFIRAISDYNKHSINNIYSCMEKCHVIRCGIDVNSYTREKSHTFDMKTEKIRLISIGRFVEKKGFKYLIEAMSLLKEENIQFQLVMIGDGPLKNESENLIEKYNLGKEVFLKGACSGECVKKALLDADILVAPSTVTENGEKEGIPVVIMEAMAAGVFVIATEHSGIPEIVRNMETGMLVPEKDPLAIVEAIKLIRADSGLMKICTDRARKLVEEEVNIKNTAKLIKKLFEESARYGKRMR